MERLILTPDNVARAHTGEGFTHPLLTVLETHASGIAVVTADIAQVPGHDLQRLARERLGFLADAIEDAGRFSFEPIYQIAVWSKMSEVLSEYGYATASMVSLAYAIQGVPNPDDWKRSPRYYLENYKLPPRVLGNRADLLHVDERLEKLRVYRRELDDYTYGETGSSYEHQFELAIRAARGDEEANKELARIETIRLQRATPLINRIGENFANTNDLAIKITLALREIEVKS